MNAATRALLAVTVSAIGGLAHAETPGAGDPVQTLPTLPAGLTLPARLSQTIHAGRVAPGLPVRATTSQRIPLGRHTYLPAGVLLEGKVVAATAHLLALRFDTIALRGRSLPMSTRALAIASFVAVSNTGAPANGSTDRGNPSPANWTTAQVGGDQVARSGWSGPLLNGVTETVGSADYWGVYALPLTPGAAPHALGPFSANAAGLYGFAPDCSLTPSEVTLSCGPSKPTLHQGDVLLLQVE